MNYNDSGMQLAIRQLVTVKLSDLLCSKQVGTTPHLGWTISFRPVWALMCETILAVETVDNLQRPLIYQKPLPGIEPGLPEPHSGVLTTRR